MAFFYTLYYKKEIRKMIYLKRDVVNNVVYTASEMTNYGKGSYCYSQYILTLENQQTLETTTTTLENVSAVVGRYDIGQILVLTGVTQSVMSGSTLTLNGFPSGYYNYKFTCAYEPTTLEIGKLLIEPMESEKTIYNRVEPTTYVYDPKK